MSAVTGETAARLIAEINGQIAELNRRKSQVLKRAAREGLSKEELKARAAQIADGHAKLRAHTAENYASALAGTEDATRACTAGAPAREGDAS